MLEFTDGSPESFEKSVALQETMEAGLTSGKVDGNDVGGGVVNLFVFTKSPNRCFSEALTFVEKHGMRPSAAGVREQTKRAYIRLWPKETKERFSLR